MKEGTGSFIDRKPEVDVVEEVLPPEENTTAAVIDSEEANFQQASLDEGEIDHEMLSDGMQFECVRIFLIQMYTFWMIFEHLI